nr:MAG TPA: hypothetical protein [Caudoviricetes sp.]
MVNRHCTCRAIDNTSRSACSLARNATRRNRRTLAHDNCDKLY